MPTEPTPEVGDLIHDTVTNDLFEVEKTVSGEELGEVVSAYDDIPVLPKREPADHLEELDEFGPAAMLFAGAIVTPQNGETDASNLLVRWSTGSGLQARFDVHDPETGSMPCRACGSTLVGYFGTLDACVCADCGERWGEATPTERAFRLASEGDIVTLTTEDGATRADVEYAAGDASSLGVRTRDFEVKLALDPDGRAVFDSVLGGNPEVLTRTNIEVVHPDDPWSK